MFHSCLICTDFTDGLQRLVNFVPSLAKSGLERIVFFHSVPLWEEGSVPREDTEKIEEAKQRLSPALENIPDGVDVRVEVRSGKPLDTIPRFVAAEGIEAVIAGTPIRSLLEEKFFGSTATGLARQVSAPLLILRPQLLTTYTREELDLRTQHLWRHLLLPYNDGEAARYLLEEVKTFVRGSQSQCTLKECLLLWAIDESRRPEALTEHRLQEAREKLTQVQHDLESLGLKVRWEVRQGNPLLEILDAALVYDISAIAVGSDERGGLLEWTAPSLAKEILRRSWFPVMFFSEKRS